MDHAHAQELLRTNSSGVLSTHSQEMQGYPFGSVVPYCLDGQGLPIILISHIAQHYHNIQAIPKVSLLVLERGSEDVQMARRLTWVADAQPLTAQEEDTIDQYYQAFPASHNYHKTLGFHFFRLVPVRICYIAGFGRIHWYDAKQWS